MIIENKKYNIFDFIIIPFKTTPFLTILRIVDKIIYALIPSFTVLVTARFINTAMDIFAGQQERTAIYLPLILLMLIISHQYINWALMNFVTAKIKMKLNESFKTAIVDKRAKLEYAHIENNDTWEIIKRVCSNPEGYIFHGFDILLRMIDMIVRVISLLVILFLQVWWAGIVIVGFSIPLFYVSIKSGKTNYEAFKEATKYERKAEYLKGILSSRENVEERSMFGYLDYINKQWFNKYEDARKINFRVQGKNFIRMKSASLITLVISLLITAVLIRPLGRGQLSIGMFISLITATFSLVQMFSWDLSYITKEMANNVEYLKDLSTFSSLSEEEDALDKPSNDIFDFESLEFVNVKFKYPNTEKYILNNCSFKIVKNMHYAFVGVNGAGKTTITKLLTGLYSDYEGDIYLNDKNIGEYSYAQLKSIFSVTYQDFAKYYISMRDNIALGNVNGVSDERIMEEAELIELSDTLEKLPDGIDTYLGKIKENSVDLSAGEWQRVAIARALVGDRPVRILDEPTAALDPIAESNIYEMFGKISSYKTTIFITHRLGAAKLADEIFVINDGHVIEKGNHDFLMRNNGIYSEMFESQRSWYN